MTLTTAPNTESNRALLIDNLRRYGIRFLASGDPDGNHAEIYLSPEEIIVRLAQSADPRLRLALVPFFILHPQEAAKVNSLVDMLDEPAKTELMMFYMAAVYLQRFWKTRLQLYLPEFPLLPDSYSHVLSLPKADDRHGKSGLYALAERHANQSPYAFNRLASY